MGRDKRISLRCNEHEYRTIRKVFASSKLPNAFIVVKGLVDVIPDEETKKKVNKEYNREMMKLHSRDIFDTSNVFYILHEMILKRIPLHVQAKHLLKGFELYFDSPCKVHLAIIRQFGTDKDILRHYNKEFRVVYMYSQKLPVDKQQIKEMYIADIRYWYDCLMKHEDIREDVKELRVWR